MKKPKRNRTPAHRVNNRQRAAAIKVLESVLNDPSVRPRFMQEQPPRAACSMWTPRPKNRRLPPRSRSTLTSRARPSLYRRMVASPDRDR